MFKFSRMTVLSLSFAFNRVQLISFIFRSKSLGSVPFVGKNSAPFPSCATHLSRRMQMELKRACRITKKVCVIYEYIFMSTLHMQCCASVCPETLILFLTLRLLSVVGHCLFDSFFLLEGVSSRFLNTSPVSVTRVAVPSPHVAYSDPCRAHVGGKQQLRGKTQR